MQQNYETATVYVQGGQNSSIRRTEASIAQEQDVALLHNTIKVLVLIFFVEASCLVAQHWNTFHPMANVLLNNLSLGGDVSRTALEGARGFWHFITGNVHVNGDIVEIGVSASQRGVPNEVGSWGPKLPFVSEFLGNIKSSIPGQ